MKSIPGLNGYFASRDGKIYSNKQGRMKELSLWRGSSPYLCVALFVDGKKKNMAVHRFVAIAYLGYKKDMVVHHKDGNTFNNNVQNLEWVTQQNNVHKSYKELGPTRNKHKTKLYFGSECVGTYETTKEAAKEAEIRGASFHSIIRYHKSQGYSIEKCND